MESQENAHQRIVGEKVVRIASIMGYHPNQLAISLRTAKSRLIGLVVESISGRFFASMAEVVEDEAERFGYRVVCCSNDNDPVKGAELLRMLVNRQVDGYLITPNSVMEGEVRALAETGKPLVLIDSYYPNLKIPHVVVDNYEGARQGIRHLVKKEFRESAL